MDQSQEKLSEKTLHPVLLILIGALFFVGSQVLAATIMYPLVKDVGSKNMQLVLYNFASLLVLVFLLQFNRKRKTVFNQIGLKKTALKNILIVVPIFFLYACVSIAITLAVSALFKSFDSDQTQDVGFSTSLSSLELIAAFFSLVIITPIFEEIIFRRLLFRGLRKRNWHFWPSAILVSALFAVAHGQWNVALDTFILSLTLCYLVERSGSILPSIFLHSLKNSLAFLIIFVFK